MREIETICFTGRAHHSGVHPRKTEPARVDAVRGVNKVTADHRELRLAPRAASRPRWVARVYHSPPKVGNACMLNPLNPHNRQGCKLDTGHVTVCAMQRWCVGDTAEKRMLPLIDGPAYPVSHHHQNKETQKEPKKKETRGLSLSTTPSMQLAR
jgi:hypothetical protein